MELYKFTKKQRFQALLIFTLLTLSVFAGIYAVRQRYVRPKAAPGEPILSFSTSTLSSNQPFDLIVKANPNGGSFNAFRFDFTFDTSKVELLDPSNIATNFERLFTSSIPLDAQVTGNTISILGAKSNTPFTGTSDIDMVKVKMRVKSGATGTVAFNWNATTEVEGKVYSTTNINPTIGGGTTGNARLYFTSAKQTYAKGENLDLNLFLDTSGDSVNAMTFEFNYDDQIIDFQNLSGDITANNIVVDPNSGFDTSSFFNEINTQTKIIRVGLITTAQTSGNKQVATVKLKVKSTTSATSVNFTANNNSVVYNLQQQNILTQRPIYSLSISGSTACAAPPAPAITSLGCFLSTTITNQRVRTIWQAPTVPTGCELDPYFSTDPVNHHPYQIEVDDDPVFPHSFDPTFTGTAADNYYANYLGTTDSTSQTAFISSSPTLPKTVYARVRARNKFGQLSSWSSVSNFVVGPLTCTTDGLPSTITPTGTGPTPTGTVLKKVGTINFRVKTGVSGSAPVDFRTTPDSTVMVIEQGTATDILGQTSGLTFIISGAGISPTITPAAGAPIISFNVKFRDINRDIGSPIVVVRVKKDTFFREFTNIPLTHTSNGVYLASNVALNGVPVGSGYKLFVKGPKHLAKGFSNISLVAGNNTAFDWSGTPLEPGDLPPQDGVINSQDISRLIELLDTPTFSQTDLDTADLNYDGTINGGDVNELILTLSEKFDEDKF